MKDVFRMPPRLSRGRMVAVLFIAATADALQILLLPFAWTFVESFIDVVAMVFIVALIGFHPLLLPTFVVEVFPVIDALPTWTGCVIAVMALRRRSTTEISVSPPPPPPMPIEPPQLPPPSPPV